MELGNTLYICNANGDGTCISVWYGDESSVEGALASILTAEGDYTGLSIEDVEELPLRALKNLAKKYLDDSVIIYDGKVIHVSGRCEIFGRDMNAVYITGVGRDVEVHGIGGAVKGHLCARRAVRIEYDRIGERISRSEAETFRRGGLEEEADRIDMALAEQHRGGLILIKRGSQYEEYYSNDVIDIDSYEF